MSAMVSWIVERPWLILLSPVLVSTSLGLFTLGLCSISFWVDGPNPNLFRLYSVSKPPILVGQSWSVPGLGEIDIIVVVLDGSQSKVTYLSGQGVKSSALLVDFYRSGARLISTPNWYLKQITSENL